MRYMFLAYADDAHWDALSTADREAIQVARIANDHWLRDSGHLVASAEMQRGHSVTTVRAGQGRVTITDGPFMATTEQLIGLFLINARDLNHAIHLAATMPQARRGPIEVLSVVGSDGLSDQWLVIQE